MNELIKILDPLKKRIIFQKMCNFILISFCVMLLFDTIIIILSKFIFINNIINIVLGFNILILVLFIITIILNIPRIDELATEADKLGFQERFVTALELCRNNSNNIILNLIINDISNYNRYYKLYKIRINNKMLKLLTFIFIMFFLSFLLPYSESNEFQAQTKLHEIIKEEVKKVEKLEDEIIINKHDIKEVKKQINNIKKELLNSKNEAEAIKNIQNAQHQLKKISKKSVPNDLIEVAQELEKIESTKGIAQKINDGDIQKINDDIKSLSENIKTMDAEQIKQLSNDFKKAINNIEDKNVLKEGLNKAVEAIKNNIDNPNIDEIDKSLNELSQTIKQAAKENEQLRQAIDKINNSLSEASNVIDKKQENIQEATYNDSSKSRIKDINEQSNINNNDSGKGHIENSNEYLREAQEYSDYKADIKGIKNDNATKEKIEVKGSGDFGNHVSYDKVYNQYKNEAFTAIENDNIPFSMKEIVKDYFSSLEE